MVGKFRLFENVPTLDTRADLTSYLALNTTGPLTKSELLDHIGMNAMTQVDLSKLFRVKVAGKDKDPIFWSFGKIHGLENIAFADPEELKATGGNPVKI
jgi:hypothetical protein